MLGYGLLACAIAFGGLFAHDRYLAHELKATESELESLEARLETEAERRKIDIDVLIEHQAEETDKLNAAWRKRLTTANTLKGRRIAALEEELRAYVTPLADSRCVVPVGAVVYHDAAISAAAGGAAVSAAAGRSVDADSGVALSTVVGTAAKNYVEAHDVVERLTAEVTAWRDWYVAQRELFNRKASQ